MSAFRERLHRASRYNPEAIQRMLDNKPWAAKRPPPDWYSRERQRK